MATNAPRIFLAKWSDKGKVAYGVSELTTQGAIKPNTADSPKLEL